MTALDIAEVRRKIAHPRPEDMGKKLKLQALFLAEEDYLDKTWGKERPDNKKIYDKANKPIIWEEDGVAKKNKKTSPDEEASNEAVRLAHQRKYQERPDHPYVHQGGICIQQARNGLTPSQLR